MSATPHLHSCRICGLGLDDLGMPTDLCDLHAGRDVTGRRVLVSTSYYETGVMRDRSGGWGFGPDEWREAVVSNSSLSRIAVQFEPDGCHWSFATTEARPVEVGPGPQAIAPKRPERAQAA